MAEKSRYERLGGVFAIAAVIDHFRNTVVKNPVFAKPPRTPPYGSGTPGN